MKCECGGTDYWCGRSAEWELSNSDTDESVYLSTIHIGEYLMTNPLRMGSLVNLNELSKIDYSVVNYDEGDEAPD